mgnify:CR=1 FL=1
MSKGQRCMECVGEGKWCYWSRMLSCDRDGADQP